MKNKYIIELDFHELTILKQILMNDYLDNYKHLNENFYKKLLDKIDVVENAGLNSFEFVMENIKKLETGK